MNFHKLNGESTRNILLNEAVYLCVIRTGHSFQRRIIVNLFHYTLIVRWNEWSVGIAHNQTALFRSIYRVPWPFSFWKFINET